jgi:chemotaxis protein methyltransferase CheR
MIKLARAAVYGDRSVKGVPADYNRHLLASGTGFRVHPETSRLVRVEKLNLNDRVQMNAMRGYDFIFCRNVLIYFDDDSQRRVLNHFYDSLNSGGYIFLAMPNQSGALHRPSA